MCASLSIPKVVALVVALTSNSGEVVDEDEIMFLAVVRRGECWKILGVVAVPMCVVVVLLMLAVHRCTIKMSSNSRSGTRCSCRAVR